MAVLYCFLASLILCKGNQIIDWQFKETIFVVFLYICQLRNCSVQGADYDFGNVLLCCLYICQLIGVEKQIKRKRSGSEREKSRCWRNLFLEAS